MSPNTNQNPEAGKKKPTITESVEELISKKKAERESTGAAEVSEKAAGIQTEVSEVMAGVEKPKERVSEKKGETGEKGDITGGKTIAGAAQKIGAAVKAAILPSEEVMVRKIRAVITAQIKMEIKKAKKLQGQLTTGGAQEYNSTIARIRKLKEALSSLLTATYDFIKNLYLKYFTPEGRKRSMDEVR
jgi:hypothetical protein